jgi:hypothetical protein
MSRDVPFQHLKLISSKAFEVCRPSKPCPLLTMGKDIFVKRELPLLCLRSCRTKLRYLPLDVAVL